MVGGQNPHPLAAAAQQGEGGNGRLEHRRHQARQASGLAFLSRGAQHSLAQSAIRFILMEPGVTAVLGGFSDAHQVEDVAAASGAGSLTPEEMARIEMVWRANFGS
jgi:aryl-alcohol dehydrogenase-like predicted oxidoreductase